MLPPGVRAAIEETVLDAETGRSLLEEACEDIRLQRPLEALLKLREVQLIFADVRNRLTEAQIGRE